MCAYLFACGYVHMHRLEEGLGSPGARVAGDCVLFGMGARN